MVNRAPPKNVWRKGDGRAKAATENPASMAHRFTSASGAQAHARAKQEGVPKAMPGNHYKIASMHRTFGQKVRFLTDDGQDLIFAVLEVFARARENQDDEMILQAATWLADRGFGKPVQVTQLTDAEGQAVAFTLWQPVADVEEALAQQRSAQSPDIIEAVEHIQPAPRLLPPPERPRDLEITEAGWERGIVKDWATQADHRLTD